MKQITLMIVLLIGGLTARAEPPAAVLEAEAQRIAAMNKAKDQGLLRTEGKDYRVRDGDILNVRFSV